MQAGVQCSKAKPLGLTAIRVNPAEKNCRSWSTGNAEPVNDGKRGTNPRVEPALTCIRSTATESGIPRIPVRLLWDASSAIGRPGMPVRGRVERPAPDSDTVVAMTCTAGPTSSRASLHALAVRRPRQTLASVIATVGLAAPNQERPIGTLGQTGYNISRGAKNTTNSHVSSGKQCMEIEHLSFGTAVVFVPPPLSHSANPVTVPPLTWDSGRCRMHWTLLRQLVRGSGNGTNAFSFLGCSLSW
jgi:hypothetical protein